MLSEAMKYIYGPVNSRRLGLSLGVSLTGEKTCSFNCVYCQLGRTVHLTIERKEYAATRDILEELKTWLEANPEAAKKLSYISLCGLGEPTLNTGIGELISAIKQVSRVPVAVITNASLFSDAAVRRAVSAADLIVPTLNAATDNVFIRINRPHAEVKLGNIIEGLVNLRREFRGKIWLEVMLVRGINDDIRYIKKLREVTDKINPDKIQLNSPVRTTAEAVVLPVDKKKLEKIKEILGPKAEIV